MRLTTSQLALLALPALIDAVKLSDMTPRAQNLPSECSKIYTSEISGCAVSDFTASDCSQSCIRSLQSMVDPIQEACGGNGLSGQNLVVAFLAGVGPQQICKNAPDPSSSATSQQSTQRSSATSTNAPSTTTARSSRLETDSLLTDTSRATSTRTSEKTPEFSGTQTVSSLQQDPTFEPTTSAGPTTTESSPSSTESSSDNSQDNEDQSGGGSPFDSEGNMYSGGADSLSSTSVLVSIAIAFIIMAFLFR